MPTNKYQIDITDNYNSFVSKRFGPFAIKDQGKAFPPKNKISQEDQKRISQDLSPIANKSLSQLKEENPHLLIFPEDLAYLQDGFDDKDKIIFSLYPDKTKEYIETGNVMGWIGCGNTQLRIYSRFDSTLYENMPDDNTGSNEEKKDRPLIKPKNDFFMYYLLSRVGAFHLTALDYTEGEGPINNLLMLMFPECLKNAVNQGLYKEYKTFEKNDSNVRGTINVNKHIRQNFPFMGKVAYRTREFSFDNDITQLIRHTIEYINESQLGASILKSDADANQCVEVIYQATPTYCEKNRGTVLNNNLRHKILPYYTDYITLQKLCFQILQEEGVSYGVESEDKVHGILFDGAWLWEAYVNKLLSETKLGFVHPDNIAKTNAFKMFKTREEGLSDINEDTRDAYPDFYNDNCVLDAKYKHLEKKIQRSDLYQVISYMHTMPRNIGGYIYPYQNTNGGVGIKMGKFILNGLNGTGGEIYTIPFLIPYYNTFSGGKRNESKEWNTFTESMRKAEEHFKEDVQNIMNSHSF